MPIPYKYKKIDAFTSGNSLGNPAACLYLGPGQELSEPEMLGIAKQHKGFVSEVIYCSQNDSGIHLTYYSSECQVDFCGHGTIACIYSLVKDTPALLNQKKIEIVTNKKGKLTVFNEVAERDAVFITAPKPLFIGTELRADHIAANLGVNRNAIRDDLPLDVIDAGLRTLIVPLCSLDAEVSIFPNEQALKAFCIGNDMDIILCYSTQTEQNGYIAHTRVFAPRFGYLEDPATGSGNSAFGYYMLKNGLWNGEACYIEQGGRDRVYNTVQLSQEDGAVLFGGSATVRIDGVYWN